MNIDPHNDALPTFVPGMGATYQIGADRYPCTVRRVTPCRVTVTLDRALGFGLFEPVEDGDVVIFTLRTARLRWQRMGGSSGYLHAGRSFGA